MAAGIAFASRIAEQRLELPQDIRSRYELGTLLMPVVALFFPLELAIAMTALVHVANNLIKMRLLGRKANG